MIKSKDKIKIYNMEESTEDFYTDKKDKEKDDGLSL